MPPAACKTRAAWQGRADIRFTLRETAIRSIRWNALAMIVCGDPSPQHLNTGLITCLTYSLTYLLTCCGRTRPRPPCSLSYLAIYLMSPRATTPSTLTCLHTCVLTNLLAYSIEYLPTYLVAYIGIRLPVCLDTHMLTREHSTLYK